MREDQIRDALHTSAEKIPDQLGIPAHVLRKTQMRVVRNVAIAGLGAVGVVVIAAIALAQLDTSSSRQMVPPAAEQGSGANDSQIQSQLKGRLAVSGAAGRDQDLFVIDPDRGQ